MAIAPPALSQDEWNKRYYDLQIGSLYPVTFIFTQPSGGISGDGGAISYLQQTYIVPTFSGLAAISSFCAQSNVAQMFGQVSLSPTVTLADSATQPVDQGNILYQSARLGALFVRQYNYHDLYYPGLIPLQTGVTVYLNMIVAGVAPPTEIIGSITLHLLQTGLLV